MSDLGKRYLYNGVLLRCDKGTIPTPFTVLPRPSRIRGQFQAHELDRVPLVNIKPFGACALKYGSPCLPMAPQWTQVHQGALRLGPAHAHPLLETSVCQCKLGGRITPLMAPLLPTVAGLEPIPGVTPLYGPDPVAPPDPNAGDATAHEVAEGFKWAALGLAVLGAGLAIAGCFFPPLELAAGASFEAALAASAGTAFVAADASLAIGVGLDLAVAEVHPSPANQAVVVGDLVGLALGYGIGKAIGAAVSKFGPAVVEAFSQRAAQKASFVDFIESVRQFKGGAQPELARTSYELYLAGKWNELESLFERHNINDGWPPNGGAISISTTSLKPKYVFDRFGGYIDRETGEFTDKGSYIAPDNVPFAQRALQESAKSKPYYRYEVLKEIPNVKEGKAIPWFGQPGKGTQFELPDNINNLIRDGFIRRLPN